MTDHTQENPIHRYQELKRLLAAYRAFIGDLPPKPQRGKDLGSAFATCVLEANFIFPGFRSEEREALALVRLAGANILARYLMGRSSAEGLAQLGFHVTDKKELDRMTRELEVDFVACRNHILANGIPDKMTQVQRLFWEEWSNPLQSMK